MNKVSKILINSLRIKHFPKVHIKIEGVGPSGQVGSAGNGGGSPRGQRGAYLMQMRGIAWAKEHVGDGGA